MNPAGHSGTSESNTPHTEGERFGERWNTQQSDLPPDALTGEMGEPAGDIEIVAVEVTGLPPAGLTQEELDELSELSQPSGGWFRWWYIPAVLVPAAAGVATTLWLVNRRRQPAVVQSYRGVADRVRGWRDDLAGQQAARSTQKSVKRGVKSAKSSASDLTSKATAALSGIGATGLAERAGDAVKDALDDASDAVQDAFDRVRALWERNTPSASSAKRQAKSQAKTTAAQATGALSGLWQTITNWSGGMNPRGQIASARNQARSSLSNATAPVMSALNTAGARTQGAVQSVGDSVSSTARALRAFTFGAVVSSIATYLGITRRRARKPVMRETASGRMLPGYWPKFGNRAQQTAAGGRSRR